MILPDLLLTLDKHSSWRVGGGGGGCVPMIRSAVRTTLRSFLFFCFLIFFRGSTSSAGPFSLWTQCDCPTSGPEKLWSPGI